MKKINGYNGLIVSAIFLALLVSLTVGYAAYGKVLNLNSNITLSSVPRIRLAGVRLDSSASDNSLDNYGSLTLDNDDDIVLNYNFSVNNDTVDYQATYLFSIENPSGISYTFTGINFNPVLQISNGTEENTHVRVTYHVDSNNVNNNLNIGEEIGPHSTKTVAIVLNVHIDTTENVTVGVTGGGETSSTTENVGSLNVTFASNINSVDLSSNNTQACFNARIINTFDQARTVNFSSSNSNFTLTNSSGGSPSFTINPPDEFDSTANDQTVTLCMRLNGTPKFMSNTVNTNILYNSAGIANSSIKSLSVAVDKYEEPIIDDHIPEISGVNLSVGNYNTSNNSLPLTISWNLVNETDSDTAVNDYFIRLYDASDNSLVTSFETGSGSTSYNASLSSSVLTQYETNMVNNNHNYYVRVYGVDDAGNSGSNNCSGTNNYCPSSNNASLKWKYNINTSGLSNITLSGNNFVYKGSTYSATLAAAQGYNLPDSLTSVTMGGNALTAGSGYTYTQSSGAFNVTVGATGDIAISGAGAASSEQTCLIKGTKIKTYGGYKNVEDVNYDDLIVTFSYDLGREVYVYPIWIKEPSETDHYQRTTFSDGTVLETFHNHSIFSKDLNKYVSVMDRDNFHIGTNVVKIKDGNISTVSVVNIETIYENTSYYHVEATHYLNAITNDLLTVDGFYDLSNMYTFNDDLTWSNERINNLNNGDLFVYNDLSLFFPEYLFNGLRLEEAKFLVLNGTIDVQNYVSSLSVAVVKEVPKNSNGNNIWMVTTSDELNNNSNGSYYEEGSYYTLPEPINNEGKEFVGWYSTSDNIYYKSGDKVKVKYGMYFDAIWK